MKFNEYKYERPDYKLVAEKLSIIADKLDASNDLEEIKKLIEELNKVKIEFDTMITLVFIRNSINTQDKYYEDEMELYQNESGPISSSDNKLTKVLVNHKLRKELEKIYGSYWFKKMEVSLKTFDDSIIELMIKEGKLTTEYAMVMASAQIEFDGNINNLSQMRKYLNSVNRNVRYDAMMKINEFLSENEEKIDSIYDELVYLRNDMAVKLGYKNFIELGYYRMGRTDYNEDDVAKYRKQVLEEIVPVANRIINETMDRINVSNPKFYDLSLEFLDGNPTPKGNKDELVAKAFKMYSEMSSETKEFFEFMIEHELLDLETKKGKQNGGYCTYIAGYSSPFIFSNFNGTKGDIDVLTHEAGHAFMAYCAKDTIKNPDLCWPTSEAAEIHSMSMEFFAYPWMELFCKEDTKKYKVSHMNGAITFIPYGVCVDHFQHLVYENPNATPAERKDMWKNLEKLYTPWRDMKGISMYEKGAYWFNQNHIFTSPFYYIDYTLAQVCALEFYLDSLDNHKEAWDRYVKLCKLGGSKSFLELINSVGIHNPFIEGSLHNIVNRLLPVIEEIKL